MINEFNVFCLSQYEGYINTQLDKTYEDYKCVNTLISYTNDIKQFLFFLCDKKCTDASYIDAIEWIDSLKNKKGENIKPKTRNRKIASLNSFYNMLIDFKIENLKINPFKHVKLSKINKRVVQKKEILEIEELIRIKNFLENEVKNPKRNRFVSYEVSRILALRNRALLNLMIATGMRVSEVCNLEMNEILINNDIIEVFIPYYKAKGKEDRTITISKEVYDYIVEYRDSLINTTNFEYVFFSKNGKQLDNSCVDEIVKDCIKKVGINKNISCHSIRHTYASHMLNQEGVTSEAVAESLGHKNTNLLKETYFHKTEEIKKRTIFTF